jgi:HSP20 family molecular chaperone IbpA
MEQMEQMHQLMHHLLSHAAPRSPGTWQPPADLYETADTLVIRVELAGVREEDIDITLFADHLSITGTRHNSAVQSTAYHLAGIMYGEFNLVVPVVTAVQREEVEASFDNGLLTITLPKLAERSERTAIGVTTPAGSSRQIGATTTADRKEE